MGPGSRPAVPVPLPAPVRCQQSVPGGVPAGAARQSVTRSAGSAHRQTDRPEVTAPRRAGRGLASHQRRPGSAQRAPPIRCSRNGQFYRFANRKLLSCPIAVFRCSVDSRRLREAFIKPKSSIRLSAVPTPKPCRLCTLIPDQYFSCVHFLLPFHHISYSSIVVNGFLLLGRSLASRTSTTKGMAEVESITGGRST